MGLIKIIGEMFRALRSTPCSPCTPTIDERKSNTENGVN